MARSSDYITEVRTHVRTLLGAYNALKSLQLESNALDYVNSLPDGIGANEGVTKEEVTAVVFTTTDAITALLGSGHSTNLAKLL